MPKLTPWSGTNSFTKETWVAFESKHNNMNKSLKEIGGGQGLRKKTKSLNPEYTTNITYNSIFEFAKAQHKYYSESTADSRAEVYEPYKQALKHNEGDNTKPYLNISKDDMLTINSHIIKLLNDTFKKEVDKNILLENTVREQKEELMLYSKRLKELDRAEKNRKDPHYREQLIKISLLIGFGIMLWAGSYYL